MTIEAKGGFRNRVGKFLLPNTSVQEFETKNILKQTAGRLRL